MGLDQYAYVATRANQNSDWWDGADLVPETNEFVNPKIEKPREIAYWRKHPNLQGWMEQLWRSRNTNPAEDPAFNGVELELTWDDLEQLEHDIKNRELPETTGFFFGNDSDEYYQKQDLEFVKEAKCWLFFGYKVFYNSSW